MQEAIINRVKELRKMSDDKIPGADDALECFMEGFSTATNFTFGSLGIENNMDSLLFWGKLHEIAYGNHDH